ncbi:hypothetical protein HY004_03080 [Candidatus Saccharibacteria bacterium]|nr:hypothetical protein [Candidatus Saccharibacteria bacterium]
MSKFIAAYSKLISMKNNLPDYVDVEESWVRQFHECLESISDILDGQVDEFKVPESDIKHQEYQISYNPVQTELSKDKFCDRSKLMVKIDAVLTYIQLKSPPEDKKQIGFHA